MNILMENLINTSKSMESRFRFKFTFLRFKSQGKSLLFNTELSILNISKFTHITIHLIPGVHLREEHVGRLGGLARCRVPGDERTAHDGHLRLGRCPPDGNRKFLQPAEPEQRAEQFESEWTVDETRWVY